MSIDEQEKPESTPDGELVNEQPDAAADQMPADEQVPSTEAPAVDSGDRKSVV